ncbi:MAG: hypothetical protein J0H10_07955 [Alphaproteobacteria bacterium]|nr:hypothetical protein [Alphaproteobacteria bacterium]
MSTMGFALSIAVAIGANVAQPERKFVSFAGGDVFIVLLQETETNFTGLRLSFKFVA